MTPSMPMPSLPYTDKLPKPEEFVASAYDFAEQLLASQRKFAEDVLHATTPMMAAKNGTNGPPPGRPTPRPSDQVAARRTRVSRVRRVCAFLAAGPRAYYT